jgi:hypothetical protein
MQPRRASSVVADKMNKQAPYRIAAPATESPNESAHFALEPWLFTQIVAHILVLLTYGACLALLAVLTLCMTFDGSIAALAAHVGCGLVFISVWKVFARAKQREHSLWRGVPIAAHDLLHEWLHYGFGAIVCAGLCFASVFYLPSLAFCIYSLICLVKIVNASRADREDHLA